MEENVDKNFFTRFVVYKKHVLKTKELKTCGVVKKAKELCMTPDPGPEVEGYVERNFEDPIPNSREADVYIAELERDFNKDEE